jgi:type VI secretion system ImpH/TssG family protein
MSKSTPDPRELFAALARAPGEYDFFQALRRIEAAFPEKPRLGEAARPADEPVRLGQEPSLAFPPASLASATAADGERAARVAVRFFGLFGPNGPLPLHLTEHAREQIRDDGDHGFSRFADIFHHRLLLLFYRAWAKSEPVRMRDRPDDDEFAQHLAALIGLALPTYGDRNLCRAFCDADAQRGGIAGVVGSRSRRSGCDRRVRWGLDHDSGLGALAAGAGKTGGAARADGDRWAARLAV